MKNRAYLVLAVLFLVAFVTTFGGCGGSGGGSSSGSSGDNTVRHIAVDPYIVGAQFFEDLNGDGVQNVGEQISTLSDANGIFTFSSPLSTGATVVLSDTVTAPLHNGVTYTGEIKRNVDATGALVCSPLTTLLANGWTEQNIIDALTTAGLSGLTPADIRANPMAGINELTTVTEIQLAKIRASTSIYAFMSVMDILITGQGYDISYTTFTSNSDAGPALQAMVDSINFGISSTLLARMQDDMSAAPVDIPAVIVNDCIRADVAMTNYIIPQVAAAPTTFIPDYVSWSNLGYQLGLNFYIIRNKTNTNVTGALSAPETNPLKEQAIANILTFSTLTVNSLGAIVGQ